MTHQCAQLVLFGEQCQAMTPRTLLHYLPNRIRQSTFPGNIHPGLAEFLHLGKHLF